MAKQEIKSIFEQIAPIVFAHRSSADELKRVIIEFVDSKGINATDKQTIVYNLNKLRTVIQIQRYLCNSLLMYEGLGVTKREHDLDGELN